MKPSSAHLSDTLVKGGKDARLSRLSQLSGGGATESDSSEFERKLRDAIWQQRNGQDEPVELAQLRDEALSLSRRYDDAIERGNSEADLNDYERVLFHQKCTDAVMGELSDQVHIFSPDHADLLLKTRARYNHLFMTMKKAYGDVHAELAATRRELQAFVEGKERMEREAVARLEEAQRDMQLQLEDAEVDLKRQKQSMQRQLKDMKAEKEKVESALKALHGVFMSMRKDKLLQDLTKITEEHEQLKGDYTSVREELKKTRTELSRFVSEDVTYAEESCQTDYYLMRGSKTLRTLKKGAGGDEAQQKGERKNMLQAASDSVTNASKEMQSAMVDDSEADTHVPPPAGMKEVLGGELDISITTFEEAAGSEIGTASNVEDRSKVFRIVREFFSDKAMHDAFAEFTKRSRSSVIDYFISFCRFHVDGGGKDPISRTGKPFFPSLSETVSIQRENKEEYAARCAVGMATFVYRRCVYWSDMFPEAQLFADIISGQTTQDEARFLLRAWLLCTGTDAGWKKDFSAQVDVKDVQAGTKFGDGSLSVEANALRCYRAAQALLRRCSTERLKEVRESLRRKFQTSMRAAAQMVMAVQALKVKLGGKDAKKRRKKKQVVEDESYTFEDSIRDSSLTVIEFLTTLLSCYRREKRKIMTSAHEKVNGILLEKATKGRGTMRKKRRGGGGSSADSRSVQSFGSASEDEYGYDDEGEEEMVVGLSYAEFCAVVKEKIWGGAKDEQLMAVYRTAVELGGGAVSFKALSAVVDQEELVAERLLGVDTRDITSRLSLSIPEEQPFPMEGKDGPGPSLFPPLGVSVEQYLSKSEAETMCVVLRTHWLSFRRILLNLVEQLGRRGSTFFHTVSEQLSLLDRAVEVCLSESRPSHLSAEGGAEEGEGGSEGGVGAKIPAEAREVVAVLPGLSRLMHLLFETATYILFDMECGSRLSFSNIDSSISYLCEWNATLYGWLLQGEVDALSPPSTPANNNLAASPAPAIKARPVHL
uniref:Uncharacterized protein n=1 Tax=Palpitomonas bilix TaxID=652834 RepID=A0A7S3GAH1_9EUKA